MPSSLNPRPFSPSPPAPSFRRSAQPDSITRLLLAFVSVGVTAFFVASFDADALLPDPALRWRAMETPHFRIYYHQRTARLARKVALVAEEAHKLLIPYVKHKPQGRTYVLLHDGVDTANGSATVLPRNVITLYTTPPDPRGELSDTDDWIRTLFYHEYLHVLHLDTMSGIWPILNVLLGKTIAPNFYQPLWWIEGWAVFVESAYTGGGRCRSSFFEMFLRSAVLEGKALPLDTVSHFTRLWPRGTIPYLYGGLFLCYLAERYGKDKLTEVSHHYGAALLPYGFNHSALTILKKGYPALWEEWLKDTKRRFLDQKKAILAHPPTAFRSWTTTGEWFGVPQYLPGGQEILVSRSDGRRDRRLLRLSNQGKKQRSLGLLNEIGVTISLDAQGKLGILSQSELAHAIYTTHDLYLFSPKDGQIRRITWGLRTRDPVLAADGKTALFIRLDGDSSSLWQIDLQSRKIRRLYQPPKGVLLSMPRLSPDQKSVVWSAWFPGGARDLLLWDFSDRPPRRLTSDRAQDIEPTWTPDGQEIVFASDKSGIYNLYALRPSDLRLRRLTNEIGGAFAPAVSPDGRRLAFLRYSASGFNLVETPFPSASSPLSYPLPTSPKRWPTISYPPSRQIFPSESYKPWRSMLPLTWLPFLRADALGQALGFRFNGADILQFHLYDVSAWWNFESQTFSYALQYQFRGILPFVSLAQGLSHRFARDALFLNGKEVPFLEHVLYASVALDLPLSFVYFSHTFSLRYDLEYLSTSSLPLELRPDDIPPRYPDLGLVTALSFRWSFSNARRFGYSVSDEAGRRIFLQVRLQHPALGSIGESWDLQGRWSEYLRMPWALQHVLALHLEAAIGRSNFRSRALFALGGPPTQDFGSALLSGGIFGFSFLRGYPPFFLQGDTYGLFKAEYRFPVFEIERGYFTLPLFLRRLYLTAFADLGLAFHGLFVRPDDLRLGLGLEIRAEFFLFYTSPYSLHLGFAKGLMQGGIDQFYLHLGVPF